MNTISETYTLKYQHKDYPYYQWTVKGILFNIKTGRKLKKVYNNGSIGYCINGTFISANALRNKLELIEDISCPF